MSFKKIKNFFKQDRLLDIYEHLEQAGVTHWTIYAAALSYYSIMGVVPFLALCFAVAKSFGLEQALVLALNNFFTSFDGQEEILNELKTFAENLISNYSGGLMAFVALGLIFWSGYRLLTVLEKVMGTIFGYHPPRRLLHRFMDYFTVMIIIPMILVLTAAINIFLTGLATSSWSIPLGINPSGFLSLLVVISPYIMWWLVLAWAYAYFSRSLARWPERLVGGLLTGLCFQVFQTFYIKVMINLTSYNAIYGSFAAIPLFMVWLYVSWLIVLSGGELTRRLSDYFVFKSGFFALVPPATWENTTALSQEVLVEIVRNYSAEPQGRATTITELALSTKAPLPRLGSVITRLLFVDLIVRVSNPHGGRGPAFLPARSPQQLTPEYVCRALDSGVIEIID